MKSFRLSDHKGILKIIKKATDFRRRAHSINLARIIYYLIIALLISLLLMQGLFGVLHANIDKYQLDNLILSSITINAALAALIVITMLLMHRMQNTIMISEFQNLLFASTISQNSLFFMFLSQNKKDIIYIDPSSRKILKLQEKSIKLNAILKSINLEKNIISHISEKLSLEEEVDIQYNYNDQNIKLKFMPLTRPKGFFAIMANTIIN